MGERVRERSIPPGAQLSAGLQPEPWLRGRWFGGMRVAQYSLWLWGTGVSLQHLPLPRVYLSIVVVWKTLKRDTWSCQIIHRPELPGWHLAYIQFAAGHSAPSTTHKAASIWQPHTIESLNSSSLLELRHHKKFNTSQSWLPWWECLVVLGCCSSTAKGTVLCQSPNLVPACFRLKDIGHHVLGLSPWSWDPWISKLLAMPVWKVLREDWSWWWNWDPGNNCCEKSLDISSQDLVWNITAADGLLGDCRQAFLLMVILKRQYTFFSGVNMMLLHKSASLDILIYSIAWD